MAQDIKEKLEGILIKLTETATSLRNHITNEEAHQKVIETQLNNIHSNLDGKLGKPAFWAIMSILITIQLGLFSYLFNSHINMMADIASLKSLEEYRHENNDK